MHVSLLPARFSGPALQALNHLPTTLTFPSWPLHALPSPLHALDSTLEKIQLSQYLLCNPCVHRKKTGTLVYTTVPTNLMIACSHTELLIEVSFSQEENLIARWRHLGHKVKTVLICEMATGRGSRVQEPGRNYLKPSADAKLSPSILRRLGSSSRLYTGDLPCLPTPL